VPAIDPASVTSPASSETLRIVLFGPPNAGKSALLGALALVAHHQPERLGGKLDDPTKGLAREGNRLYKEGSRRTTGEVVAHPVEYRPTAGVSQKALLIDCDGEPANRLLAADQAPTVRSPDGSLAREIVRADALVLAVDAASTAEQLDQQLETFGRFLNLLEISRGARIEVGGLPVLLVLTKCDLLAKPSDSTADWMDRIEARKREVDERVRAFLGREAGDVPAFGGLDLHVWDAAVRRPELRGAPARPHDPYHVGELFRQAFALADKHHDRVQGTGERLAWTAGGAGGVLLLLLTLGGTIFFQGWATPPSELERRVESLMIGDRPQAGERLAGKEAALRYRLSKLEAVQSDPEFETLSSRYRTFIEDRGRELVDYLAYLDHLRRDRAPSEAAREETLKEIEESLKTRLALPSADWAPTEAGQLHAQWLAEVAALEAGIRKASQWYFDNAAKARELIAFTGFQGTADAPGIDWPPWLDDTERLLGSVQTDPFPENAVLPDAPALTWANVFRFSRVKEARADWETVRRQLERVRNVAAAVGLVREVDGRPASLLIPRMGFTLSVAASRLASLRASYPNFQNDFTRAGLPGPMLPELTRAARANYEYLLKPAQAAVLNHLREAVEGPVETPERWARVRDWLALNPIELSHWRVLALTLARLEKADAVDPVTALQAFLEKTSFRIDISRITLEIPESLHAEPPVGASVEIYHARTRPDKPALILTMAGEGRRDLRERVWRYEFALKEGGPLTYVPGDTFTASLILREGQVLTWAGAPSTQYQFGSLQRPPILHRAGQDVAAGNLAGRVRLTAHPGGGVPAIPDLMPDVNLQ
jgi:hypothetical protein